MTPLTRISSAFCTSLMDIFFFFFFQAEDGIRDIGVTGVQTCALPICRGFGRGEARPARLWFTQTGSWLRSPAARHTGKATSPRSPRSSPINSAFHQVKIGRASCRERVYVAVDCVSVDDKQDRKRIESQ